MGKPHPPRPSRSCTIDREQEPTMAATAHGTKPPRTGDYEAGNRPRHETATVQLAAERTDGAGGMDRRLQYLRGVKHIGGVVRGMQWLRFPGRAFGDALEGAHRRARFRRAVA